MCEILCHNHPATDWLSFAVSRTTVNVDTGCWEYNCDPSHNGYGRIVIDGKRVRIHRASYSRFVGEIPEGMFICHHCDVRSCWNPQHLFVGSAADNYRDMVGKGRNSPLLIPTYYRGTQYRGGRPTLNEHQVKEIKEMVKNSDLSNSHIGSLYGVSKSAIQKIRSGETWARV